MEYSHDLMSVGSRSPFTFAISEQAQHLYVYIALLLCVDFVLIRSLWEKRHSPHFRLHFISVISFIHSFISLIHSFIISVISFHSFIHFIHSLFHSVIISFH